MKMSVHIGAGVLLMIETQEECELCVTQMIFMLMNLKMDIMLNIKRNHKVNSW